MVYNPKIGDKINKLTLLGKIKINNVKHWVCLCECGMAKDQQYGRGNFMER